MALQDEIDAAAPGAEILIPAGVHRETVVITKPLVLRGDPGAILDGGGEGPVIAINVPPGPPVRVIGLTVRNGSAQAGGGISIQKGVVEIDQCVISGNRATGFGGGGLYSQGQRLTVTRCRFEENRGRQGGAVFLDGAVQATVTEALFARNGGFWGGAVRLREAATLTLERSTVADNVAVGEGAAGTQLHLSGTLTRKPRLTLRNCILSGGGELLFNSPEHPATVEGSHVLATDFRLPATVLHQLSGDPAFSGEAPTPYRPRAGSAAGGRGDPTGLPPDAVDLEGKPRKRGGGLDLGAYSLLP
ncbi:MAG: right-handed parallel beta-helix repeat-containing protein [Myxococcota bacterium]|nr:right-handed parallel beta-helix repeat-containing protein [Myxococcota bacterium]